MKYRYFALILLSVTFLVINSVNAETTLRKNTGEEITGEIIKFENEVVTLRTPGGEIRIPLAELDDSSKYIVQKQFTEYNKPDQHMKLAEFCIEKQLYKEAIEEILLAGEISDKILESAYHMLLKARLLHADSLRTNAKKKYEEKQFLDALNLYKTLYKNYPDANDKEETAKEIKRLQALIGRPDDVLPKQESLPSLLLRNFENKNMPDNKDDNKKELGRTEQNKLEKEQKKFEYCEKLINEAWEQRKKALKKNTTNEFIQKKNLYKNAEGKINDAVKLLDEIIATSEKYEFMKELQYDAKKTKSGANDRMIEIAKDMMHLYSNLTTPDLRMALLWLNKVLAYSPFDKEARDLRITITESLLIQARK